LPKHSFGEFSITSDLSVCKVGIPPKGGWVKESMFLNLGTVEVSLLSKHGIDFNTAISLD